MSPESVGSPWVREELRQALHDRLSGRNIVILPILLKDCEIPGFLREKLYADFRAEASYENALQRLAESLGLSVENPWGAEVRDPFAARFGRVETYYARPKVWHCIYCGWRCDFDDDNYLCHRCKSVRPFFAPGATMVKCKYRAGFAARPYRVLCQVSLKTRHALTEQPLNAPDLTQTTTRQAR